MEGYAGGTKFFTEFELKLRVWALAGPSSSQPNKKKWAELTKGSPFFSYPQEPTSAYRRGGENGQERLALRRMGY